MAGSLYTLHYVSNQHAECLLLLQNAQAATAAAAAAAVVREATASAVMDVLEGESEEEKAVKLAAAKESRMRKVIRSVLARSALGYMHSSVHVLSAFQPQRLCFGAMYIMGLLWHGRSVVDCH